MNPRRHRSGRIFRALLPLAAVASLLAGCGRPGSGEAAADKPQLHQNQPPHGGTPVALGEDYNLELVRDAATGTLSAYVLDDEMEDFIRSPDSAITIGATVGGAEQTLVLTAVASPATGERVGDTSLFQGQADWLKGAGPVSGHVQQITIRGTPFANVAFALPAVPGKD